MVCGGRASWDFPATLPRRNLREQAEPVAISQEMGNIVHSGLGDTRAGPGCHMLKDVRKRWVQKSSLGTRPRVVGRTIDEDHTVSSSP